MTEISSNRPTSMKEVDRLKSRISALCEERLYPHADELVDASTDIAAGVYLILLEGRKPEVSETFWMEVGMKRGKRPITKLVNYVVDETPLKLRRIVQEMKNEIASTVEMLDRGEKPTRTPTFEDVLTTIERMSDQKGIPELHRQWMSHLSEEARKDQDRSRLLLDLGKQALLEQEAASRGLSVSQLAEAKERERVQQEQLEREARWSAYIRSGEVVACPVCVSEGAVYTGYNGRLVKFTAADSALIRQRAITA